MTILINTENVIIDIKFVIVEINFEQIWFSKTIEFQQMN